MANRILSIDQIVEEGILPLSRASLYRIARSGREDSPFRKRSGRWLTTEDDLECWVRNGERSVPKGVGGNPMPMPKRSKARDLLAEVQQIRQRSA